MLSIPLKLGWVLHNSLISSELMCWWIYFPLGKDPIANHLNHYEGTPQGIRELVTSESKVMLHSENYSCFSFFQTFVNDLRIPEQTYITLKLSDVIRFGYDILSLLFLFQLKTVNAKRMCKELFKLHVSSGVPPHQNLNHVSADYWNAACCCFVFLQ